MFSEKLTGDPPYLLSPTNPRFAELYDQCSLRGGERLARFSEKLRPTWYDKPAEVKLELPVSKEFGVGTVRSVYYRELILTHQYQELLQRSRFADTSHFVSQGKQRDMKEWLRHDQFLAEALKALGTSWWDIEQIWLNAFWKALPVAYRKHRAPAPAADVLIEWQVDWTDRHALKRSGIDLRIVRKWAKEAVAVLGPSSRLERILEGKLISFNTAGYWIKHPCGGYLMVSETEGDRIIHEAIFNWPPDFFVQMVPGEEGTPNGKVMRDLLIKAFLLEARNITDDRTMEDEEDYFPDYETDKRSPIVNKIIKATVDGLWKAIDVDRHSMPMEPCIAEIMKKKQAWLGMTGGEEGPVYYRAAEFYQLVADLIFHCPILRGLPDEHQLRSAETPYRWDPTRPISQKRYLPSMWSGLTAEEIRLRYLDIVKREARRKRAKIR